VTTRSVAIVTGASSGIGAACAVHLARLGFDVAINYARNEEGARATAARCVAEGAETLILKGDVGLDSNCRAIVDRTFAAWQRIDVLINNAGTTKYADARDLDGLDAVDFDRIFRTNVIGCYQMTRAAVPHMKAAPNASVVNVSSHSGISGNGSSTAYAASKGALNTLTLGLAQALAPEIRVNAVCPGFVTTDWGLAWQSDADYAAFKERASQIAPLRRIPDAEAVAESVSWFATQARYITGQMLVIDGGTHLTVGSPVVR